METILITGGAGYIGAHAVRTCLEQGYRVIVIDNLSTGYLRLIDSQAQFLEIDLKDIEKLRSQIKALPIDAIMHFAGYSQVGESVQNPQKYLDNNVSGTLNLASVAIEQKIKYFIFSSSAAVYGDKLTRPIRETDPLSPINPYGATKKIIEEELQKISRRYPFHFAALRYFNAAGADRSGKIGEKHNPETHLVPSLLQTVLQNKAFTLYGNDYSTFDGTCIRDYVHVSDLITAHLQALTYLEQKKENLILNLGSNTGYSVKQVIATVEKVTGKKVNVLIKSRRPGDPPYLVADCTKAKKILDWKANLTLEDMVKTAWQWHKKDINKLDSPC